MMAEGKKDVVDCPRPDINMLHVYLTDTVEGILKGISYEDFVGNIQTLDEMKKSTKKKVYQIFVETIKKDVIADLDQFWEDSEITEKEILIKKLMKEQKAHENTIAWRPKPADCKDNLNPYLLKLLREKKQRLEEKLEKQKKITSAKRKQVETKREAVREREVVIKILDEKLDKYIELFDQEIDNE